MSPGSYKLACNAAEVDFKYRFFELISFKISISLINPSGEHRTRTEVCENTHCKIQHFFLFHLSKKFYSCGLVTYFPLTFTLSNEYSPFKDFIKFGGILFCFTAFKTFPKLEVILPFWYIPHRGLSLCPFCSKHFCNLFFKNTFHSENIQF